MNIQKRGRNIAVFRIFAADLWHFGQYLVTHLSYWNSFPVDFSALTSAKASQPRQGLFDRAAHRVARFSTTGLHR
jgi:hypothetical protein